MKKSLIYIMGTDGSGKTTLAKNFVKKQRTEGKKVKYLYVRHVPILLYPLKLISRPIVYKKDTEIKNYEKYSEKKADFSKRYSLIARIYALVWVLDYILYYFIKVRIVCFFSNLIILDRYVGDVVVNISVATGLNELQMQKLLRLLHLFFPKPNSSFFLDVNEKKAFKRKDDIPSIQYLKERKKKYFYLQSFYNFKVIDGHLSPEKLLDEFCQQVA